MEVTENCYYNEPTNEFRAQIQDCTRPCYPPECNGLKGPMNKSVLGKSVHLEACTFHARSSVMCV